MNYGPELISALASELRCCVGCQLQRIEAGGDWCALTFKNAGSIFFTWNPETFGICRISSEELRDLRSQSVKTPFAMGLLRHLGGGSITDVACVPGDRVLTMKFQRFVGGGVSKELTLVLELTGRMSNALFTDENGIILEAAKHVHPEVNRYRSIIPGAPYAPPPPIPGELPRPGMSGGELSAFLKAPRGIGRPLADELTRLWESGCTELVRAALFGEPKIFQRFGKYLTALGAVLPGAERFNGGGLDFCRAFIAGEIERRALKNLAAKALKILERQRGRRAKHIDDLLSQIEKAENCSAYRNAGEALLQNLGKVRERQDSITLKYWDDDGEKTLNVKLDPSLDLQGNAKRYFKKYQKFRTDVTAVREQVSALQSELDDLAALEANLKRVVSAEKLAELCEQIAQQYDDGRKKEQDAHSRKVKKTLPPHLRFTLGNSLILAGMNERGNRYVTFQEAAPDDLWFHVHEFPGSHVILKNPPAGATELERAVRAAASLALCYSECRDRSSVVDYTEKKQVRHIQGGGPANVTYKRPRTVLVGPDDWKEILGRR